MMNTANPDALELEISDPETRVSDIDGKPRTFVDVTTRHPETGLWITDHGVQTERVEQVVARQATKLAGRVAHKRKVEADPFHGLS